MNLIGLILSFALIFNVSTGYVDISKLDEEIVKLNRTLKDRQSEEQKLLKESDKLAEKITKEKRKSQGRSNRKLDSMLRESQKLVSRLESTSRQRAAIEAQLKRKYATAIAAMVRNLEEEPEAKRKKSRLKQLFKYLDAVEKLKEPIKFEIPQVKVEIREDDTPLEIRAKADFLADQTALLKAKMFQIDAQVATLEKEESLRDKVRGFADEIKFFDDVVFVEEKKIEQVNEPEGRNDVKEPEGWLKEPSIDGNDTDRHTEEVKTVAPQISTFVQKETSDSPLSDLILSSGGIDEQIRLLKQQKIRLRKQIQQLSQKTQSFYKRASELNLSKPQ